MYSISPDQVSDISRALRSIADIINDLDLDQETADSIERYYIDIDYIICCVQNGGAS